MKARSKRSAINWSRRWSFGSNACASTPRRLSASSTIPPLRSEISRSALRPPSRTATLPNAWRVTSEGCSRHSRSGRWVSTDAVNAIADNAHFAFELDPELLLHGTFGEHDQTLDIGRRRASCVHDEVRVLGRNHRAADRMTLESAFLDETGGVGPGWVSEYRTRVGLTQRLSSDTPGQQLLHLAARFRAIAAREHEHGIHEPLVRFSALLRTVCARDCERLIAALHGAISDPEMRGRALVQTAGSIDGPDGTNDIPRLATVTTRVHRERTRP